MAKPFDATLKDLVATYPRDWLIQLGLTATTPFDIIDADLSTVTAAADRILRILEAAPWLLHLELQSQLDRDLARRGLRYNVLVGYRHGIPVHSVMVLLCRVADDPELTGVLRLQPPHGLGGLEFHYQVVRVWELPVDSILEGGVGTLPLAPLCDVEESALPEVIRRMEERFARETEPAEAATLWTSTYILMGLRYSRELAARVLQGVRGMKESVTYQAILEEGEEMGRVEGRAEEAKKVVLLLGDKQFGAPDADTRATIEAVTDVARLERMIARLLDVSNWEELLACA